jgi:hypothetical protein
MEWSNVSFIFTTSTAPLHTCTGHFGAQPSLVKKTTSPSIHILKH